MGEMGVYVIYDNVADEVGPLFEAKNDATARRAVRGMKMDNPDDYSLHRIGTMNRDKFYLETTSVPWARLPNLLIVQEDNDAI